MDTSRIHWHGHDAFRIEDGGHQVCLDPWKMPDGLPRADLALLPVSGTYVMTAAEAVEAANTFALSVAIPMHYGEIVGSDEDAETFRRGFRGETVILQREG